MLLCVVAAGCAADSPPAETGVPGIVVENNLGSAVSALSHQAVRPCRYTHDVVFQLTGQADQVVHSAATITYNAAGYDVLEDERDDAGNSVLRLTTDYGAMGNATHWLMEQPELNQEAFLAYDSFGRLIRYEIDEDDGSSSTATYTYGNHNLRATARIARTDRPERSYDRTYTYDAQDRVIRLDRDFGLDGTIDESERYVYDDVERTATMDMVSGTGALLKHTDFTFDGDQLTREVTHQVNAIDVEDTTDDYLYDAGRPAGQNEHYRDAATDGSSVFELTNNYHYQFSCH